MNTRSVHTASERAASGSDKLSPEARTAMAEFMEGAHSYAYRDILSQASCVVGTLQDYAPSTFPQPAYDTAALLPLAEQIYEPNHPIRQRAAATALYGYFTGLGADLSRAQQTRLRGYVGTLFGDSPYIDAAAREYTQRLDEPATDILMGDGAVPDQAWLSLRVGANIPNIFETNSVTNVEVQLAKTAFALDRIAHADDDDQRLFRNVLELETYHKPLLEIYGLHAFDMLLQSRIGRVRAQKSGNEAVLAHASSMVEGVKKISPDDILKEVFGRKPDSYLFQSVQDSVYDESIMYNSALLSELTGDKHEGVVNMRVKTVGKLALKLLRNPSYQHNGEQQPQPQDVFGALAVLPDVAQLGASFASTVENIRHNDRVGLVTSPSKKRPIYIQGTPNFVRKVRTYFSPEVVATLVQESISREPASKVFQVAKFTAEVQIGSGETVPIEVQFQTEADRANARLGDRSHMNHDQGEGMGANIAGTPKDLQTVAASRGKIDTRAQYVNPRSIKHGEEFRRRYTALLTAEQRRNIQ